MTVPLNPIPLPPAGGVVDAAGVVRVEAPCRKCSYNLRGARIDGRCPECGSPVGLSVHGDYLHFCDPEWVQTLRRGVNYILTGIAILIGAFVAGFIEGILSRAGSSTPLSVVIALGGNLLMVVGGWLLTTPDPSGLGENRYGTARKIIRVALVVGIASSVLNLGNGFVPLAPHLALVMGVLQFAAAIIGLVGELAQLYYLGKLAQRIPDPDLSQRAFFLMRAIGISYGLLLVLGLVALLIGGPAMARGGPPSGGAAGGLMAVGCALGLLGIAVLVFGILYLFMLARLGRRFAEQARIARATWARGGG